MPDETLTLEQLSRYTGERAERLLEWRAQGIIGDANSDSLTTFDVERVRLVQLFLRRGIDIGAVTEAMRSGLFDWFRDFPFGQTGGPIYSLAEAAEIVGLKPETIRLFRDAMGSIAPDDFTTEEELELLRGWKVASEAGVPDEAMLELVRVYADNLDRVADAEQRLYRFYVFNRLEAEGLTPEEIITRANAATDLLTPLVEPIVLYFHRRGLMRAARDDMVLTLAEQQGLVKKAESPAGLHLAVVFVDISSFTPLTEAMGDAAAARVLERLSDIVRRSVAAWSGRIVKQIGDAFMLVFPEPRSAVACALEIESQASKEPQFPAVRSGLHWGTVLYREGDYVGSNVNIASRLASEAQRHQILVTADVRREAHDLPDVEFVRLGKRKLKGLTGQLELYEVQSSAVVVAEKVIDPVCGMELGEAEIAARLSLEGSERAFCSEDCLRRFVASPHQYASANG